MWSEMIHLVVALPLAAALHLLVPRRASRTWAIWLLVCLLAVGIQGIGQEVYNHYYPNRLILRTRENQLEFGLDGNGKVAFVIVNNPPGDCRDDHFSRQSLTVAKSSLLLAFAVLLLLLRAEPAALPPPRDSSPGRAVGVSIQAFGLVVLLGSMAEAITSRGGTLNLIGVLVIASGFYLGRGSLSAAKWAAFLLALTGVLVSLFVVLIALGEKVNLFGRDVKDGESPWTLAIGLVIIAWNAVNLLLIARFLARSLKPLA